MTLDQAIIEVQQICGWRSDKNTEITSALSYAQTEREKPGMTFPWWLWKEDQSMTALTIGSQTLALPSDYIQDTEEVEGNLRYRASSTTRTFFLKKMDFETAEKYFFGDWSSVYDVDSTQITQAISPGTPKAYVLRESSLKIYPTPDAAYVLTWSYWGKDTAQASGQANAWLTNAPWVLIGDAAKKIAADLQNAGAVATAQQVLDRAEQNLFRSTIHRREAGRRRMIGSRL